MRDESKAIEWLKRVIREKTILGEETKVANIIKEILWEEAGIKSTLVPLDGDENRCNLVAEIKGNKPGPVLAFAGHMDVVPLGEGAWDVEDPFGAEEVNGRIYGRGSSDMKAGLMASVVAMINLKNSGADFSGGLKLFATAGEESGLLGSKQLREQKYADDVDAMIVGEPTQGITFAGHKGVLRIKITTDIEIPEGEKPEPGKNAINYMLKFLENYDKEFKLSDFIVEDPTDRLSLNININPPTISLNLVGNEVNEGEFEEPEMNEEEQEDINTTHWEIAFEVRTKPDLDQDALVAKLEELMRKTEQENPGLTMGLKIFVKNAPVSTPRNHPFVQLVRKANRAVFSSPLDLPGCTDASEFIQLRKETPPGEPVHLPIVIFAHANMLTAHKSNEYVDVSLYKESIKIYERIIKEYLQTNF